MQENSVADSVANGGVAPSTEQIGGVQVDYDSLTVSGPDGTVTLEPKVMSVLRVLSSQAPSVVTREAIIEQVWGGESGGDESLSRAISLLRKALGDRRGHHKFIETIPRRGYRLRVSVAPGAIQPATTGPTTVAERARLQRGWLVAAGLVTLMLLGYLAVDLIARDDTPALPTLPARSIAVLPFADLSPEADHAYFAAGLAEEILSALTNISQLQVAGRMSSFAYAAKDVDIRQIGTELGVNYVLEGSVRKDGEQLRITAQLVRADNGYHVWSRTFDGELGRVFDFQEHIARAIANALEVSLEPRQNARLVPALTQNQAAYDAFLQGRSLARRFGPQEKQRAAVLLERAVQLDPQFALAWAELARTELFLPVSFPEEPQAPHVAAARNAAERALAIDPELAMGHFVRGLIQEFELQYADALQSFSRAHRLDPGNAFLMSRYGYYLALIGHSDVGGELMEQGLRLDPTDAPALHNLGVAKLAAGDLAGALPRLQRSYELGFAPAGPILAKLLWLNGEQTAARDIWQDCRESLAGRFIPELETEEGWRRLGRMYVEENAAERAWVGDALQRYFALPDARVNAYRMLLMAQAGSPEEAFRIMREHPFPISAGFVMHTWVAEHGWTAISADDSFPGFARDIGLVDAWEEYGWPARCTSMPSLSEGDDQFRCE